MASKAEKVCWGAVEVLETRETGASKKKTHKVTCKHCLHPFSVASATRIREHLLGIGNQVTKCSKCPPQITAQLQEQTKDKQVASALKRGAGALALALTSPQASSNKKQATGGYTQASFDACAGKAEKEALDNKVRAP
jgi:hypothetical protein